MKNDITARRAAFAATAVLACLAVFQLLLALGAPLGEAAWGGAHDGTLPVGLRIGSAVSVLVYGVVATLLLRRVGEGVPWVTSTTARVGAWVVTVLLSLGALANLASSSPWERFLLGPTTVVLSALCLVVARSAPDRTRTPAPRRGRPVVH